MSKPIIRKVEFLPELPQLAEKGSHLQRVAVYARVSTDHEEQQSSLAAQKDYYLQNMKNYRKKDRFTQAMRSGLLFLKIMPKLR